MILIVLIIVLIILTSRKKRLGERVNYNYTYQNNNYKIRGRKNLFKIYKNDRFTFTVKDGNIISFKDNTVSNNDIVY